MSMYGSQAIGWNPANLGLHENPASSLTLLSFSTSLGNNAFSPKYIGNTFVEGDTLDHAKIEDILGKMSASKLKLYGLLC